MLRPQQRVRDFVSDDEPAVARRRLAQDRRTEMYADVVARIRSRRTQANPDHTRAATASGASATVPTNAGRADTTSFQNGNRVLFDDSETNTMRGGIVVGQSSSTSVAPYVTVRFDDSTILRDVIPSRLMKQPADIRFRVGRRYYKHWNEDQGWIGFTIINEPYQHEDGTMWANVQLDRVPGDASNEPREIELDQKKHAFRV